MSGHRDVVLSSIQQLFHQGPVAGLDERQLLERFVTRHDEAAFAALVSLHGPLVWGVCRRILRDPPDMEDAFQATFLVLVRRAGSVRDAGRLGPWLHGVARRVALRARADAARRVTFERRHPANIEGEAMRPNCEAERNDELGVIDEEVGRLPARYRDAVVLCDLEGRSYAEAANRLRCPLGTVQSRLARGRERLRARFVRRGLAPVAVSALLAEAARASVPEVLADAAVKAAIAMATAQGTAAGAVSATVASLVDHALRRMTMTILNRAAAIAAAVSIAFGAGLLAHGWLGSVDPSLPGAGSTDVQPPPTAPAGAQPTPAEDAKPGRTLSLKVVSAADNAPLPAAAVWVRVTRGKEHVSQGKTDEQGRFPIALPGEFSYFILVVVAHPGFVPIELRWSGDEIPAAYTLALERGVPIGGTVRDDQGRPIAGARVLPKVSGGPPRSRPEMYVSINADVAAAVTDALGRWRSDALPASAGPGVRLYVQMLHQDHVTVERLVSAAEARALTSVQLMDPGVSLAGTVLSPDGRPVAEATVVAEQQHREGTRVKTDENGRFHTGRFLDPKRSETMLTVQARGLASAVRTVKITPTIPPQVVQLAPRRPLNGRVVDAQGRSVAGAVVSATQGLGNGPLDWEAETDSNGRFEWLDAPAAGTILLDAFKPPFTQALGRRIEPGSGEVTIALHRPQHLHGTVTDAETGRAIERFVLIPGWGPDRPGGRTEWLRGESSAKTLAGGEFDLRDGLFPDQGFRRSIRIEADGYLPAELLGFLDNDEEVVHDFKLRKAIPLSGVVRGPDGRPLTGADVALSGPASDARIENGRLVANRVVAEATHLRTGPDGRYTFRPQEGRVSIVVAHDAGFAFRSPAQLVSSTDVTIVPWGRIEGILRIGPKPAPKQKVAAWLLEPSIWGRVDYDAQTDDNGRFVLDRVTPGRLQVYRYVDNEDNHGWTPSNPVNVDVKPGETVRVGIGGTGRPVVGRLSLPDGIALADFVSTGGNLSTPRPNPPTQDGFPDYTDEQKSDWYAVFRKTPEGRSYFEDDRKYAVAIHPDGTMRIEDVPAGGYALVLPFDSRSSGDHSSRLAFAHADVIVPEIPGSRSDEPLDIGAVPLAVFPFRELKVGDPAPAVTPEAADGRPLDLQALRGKFVLLSFWATYRNLTDIPSLKATYETFGRDPRFIMIGLSLDIQPDAAKRYAARRGLAWEQRYLGRGDADPVSAAFGVHHPPQVILIGPDGRLVARDLQGDGIKQAVALALGRKD